MRNETKKYIAAVCIFGTNGLLLRFLSLSSEAAVLCRCVLGTLTILLVLKLQGKHFHPEAIRNNLLLLLLSGALLGGNWLFLFAAYRATTVAVASLCNYMAPIFFIAISPFVLREHITRRQLACILAAFAGIVLVSGVLEASTADLNLQGIALGLAAAACFVGILICNRSFSAIDPLEKTVLQLAISAVVVLPAVLYNQWGHPLSLSLQDCVVAAVLGILNTGLAYIFYFGAMGSIPVQSVAILGYLEPVVSVLTSTLLLREPISVLGILGAVLILGAAVVCEAKGAALKQNTSP